MNLWCWANCLLVLGPHLPGEERPWSSQPGSPAAGAETQDGAPPPPDRRSGYSVSPLLWPHSRPDQGKQGGMAQWYIALHFAYANSECEHIFCTTRFKYETKSQQNKNLRSESSRSRWNHNVSLNLFESKSRALKKDRSTQQQWNGAISKHSHGISHERRLITNHHTKTPIRMRRRMRREMHIGPTRKTKNLAKKKKNEHLSSKQPPKLNNHIKM